MELVLYVHIQLDSVSFTWGTLFQGKLRKVTSIKGPPHHLSTVSGVGSSPTQDTCNEQLSQATANPVGGKACSSTKGGLLRYIPNTYSIHKVSNLTFAYFQGRLSRHITSPSEKTRPESWPGDYMGKATPVWRSLPPNVTNSRAKPQQTPSVSKHAHPPWVVYCAIYPTLTQFTKSQV